MKCTALVVLSVLASVAAAPPRPPFVQAVEFPYYLYPRDLWERELVWLKTIGIDTVKFSIPWNWHQIDQRTYDFSGRTSPRRDLDGFVRLLHRLGLRAWVNAAPPVANWPDEGRPAGVAKTDAGALRAWLKAVGDDLAPQTTAHGGAIAFADNALSSLKADPPPSPVSLISANDASALARSRDAIAAAQGALVWTGVEDALYPQGWAVGGWFLRKGAVGLAGDERGPVSALRRAAALLRGWGPLLRDLQPVTMPKPASGKFPDGVTAVEMSSPAASAICITNRGALPFHDELRAVEPASKRALVIPAVDVPAGESLWLPLDVTIGPDALCRECTHFSGVEHVVYATAELLSVEYENGILAMEFSAPRPGEVVLQLAREPVGPYLAAGIPTKFNWDDKALRARLPIPAGTGADFRVRIGLAMEEPETSAFFNEAKRLILGAKNTVSTTYSSAQVATRSRLRLPEGFTAKPTVKSPNEIDYAITPAADALHGDSVTLALETDGVLLGRARLQLLRPLSVKLMEAMQIHFGQHTELTPMPFTAPADPKGGANLELSLRNNYPGIQTYRLELSGDGLDLFPSKTEVTIGPLDERRIEVRVFGKDDVVGLRPWTLRISGGANLDIPMRALLLPRGHTVAWTADLDGDGSPEWILESAKARAVFSSRDGGRWMEFTLKETNVNFLPEQGALIGAGAVEVHAAADALEFTGKGWTRTVRLSEAVLSIEQSGMLPDDVKALKQGNVELTIVRESASKVVYSLR